MTKKDIIRISASVLVIVAVIVVARMFDWRKVAKEKRLSLQGVVDSVFAETDHDEMHIYARLKTEKGKQDFCIDAYMDDVAIFNDLHTGDSLSKDSGELKIYVFRQNGERKEYMYQDE